MLNLIDFDMWLCHVKMLLRPAKASTFEHQCDAYCCAMKKQSLLENGNNINIPGLTHDSFGIPRVSKSDNHQKVCSKLDEDILHALIHLSISHPKFLLGLNNFRQHRCSISIYNMLKLCLYIDYGTTRNHQKPLPPSLHVSRRLPVWTAWNAVPLPKPWRMNCPAVKAAVASCNLASGKTGRGWCWTAEPGDQPFIFSFWRIKGMIHEFLVLSLNFCLFGFEAWLSHAVCPCFSLKYLEVCCCQDNFSFLASYGLCFWWWFCLVLSLFCCTYS